MRKSLVFLVFCLFLLSGCQLAIAADAGAGNDRLIGVFITEEHLDLHDTEAYLNDLLNGKNTSDDSRYQGRLYASPDPDNLREWIFGDVIGVCFFSPTLTNDNGEPYITTICGEQVTDSGPHYFYGDNEEKLTLSGTVYMKPRPSNSSRYCNPVYQTASGEIYAVAGNGITMAEMEGEGAAFSQSLDETTTVTENGESKTVTTSVTVRFETKYPPVRVAVLQMDGQHNVLSRDEYKAGEVADSLAPVSNAAYLIIESIMQDGKVSRTLASRDDESFDTLALHPSDR